MSLADKVHNTQELLADHRVSRDIAIPVAQAPVSHEWGTRRGRAGGRDDAGGPGAG